MGLVSVEVGVLNPALMQEMLDLHKVCFTRLWRQSWRSGYLRKWALEIALVLRVQIPLLAQEWQTKIGLIELGRSSLVISCEWSMNLQEIPLLPKFANIAEEPKSDLQISQNKLSTSIILIRVLLDFLLDDDDDI